MGAKFRQKPPGDLSKSKNDEFDTIISHVRASHPSIEA